jgi:hypothetical protein
LTVERQYGVTVCRQTAGQPSAQESSRSGNGDAHWKLRTARQDNIPESEMVSEMASLEFAIGWAYFSTNLLV